jgi:uncharacterized RmlC-like cupin family protein
MKDDAVSQFSHVRPTDTAFKCEGLRDFFLYRDLGIAEATGGRLLVQLVKANRAPEKGTGWHIHEAEFHVVYMIKGWARARFTPQVRHRLYPGSPWERSIATSRLRTVVA